MSTADPSCWNAIGVHGDHSCPELVTAVHCRNCPVFADAARSFLDRPAPEGYLADWTRELDAACIDEEDRAAREGTTVVIFRLGGEWLAVRAAVVVEVTPVRPVHRIPHRGDGVIDGLVSLHGQLHLCAALGGLLGAEPNSHGGGGGSGPGGPARMIVVRRESESWVFRADEVLEVPRVPPELLQAVPATHANPSVSFSQAVFTWRGRSVGLLDDTRVFAALREEGP
jgi:chemotaxis-related protein WspD